MNRPTGILLSNLGSPDAPIARAVRRFLREFLSDRYVIKIPRLIWWPLLYGMILPTRPQKTARLYQQIWTEAGSPLLQHTKQQAENLQMLLDQRYPDQFQVSYGMRYGKPSLADGLNKLIEKDVKKVLLLPLYPQYSHTTTGSTEQHFKKIIGKLAPALFWKMISSYAEHPAYISALVTSIQRHWLQHGRAQKLIFSFHGLPQRYCDNGDPYATQCQATVTAVVEQLSLMPEEYAIAYQSRLGRARWLNPYTDVMLRQLPTQGIDSVDVICPGFAADCLETLEEINIRNRAYFLQAGGKTFRYIPCLNSEVEHIAALEEIVKK